jgi:hypothetical protein
MIRNDRKYANPCHRIKRLMKITTSKKFKHFCHKDDMNRVQKTIHRLEESIYKIDRGL